MFHGLFRNGTSMIPREQGGAFSTLATERKEKDTLKIHRCIQEGRKRKNVGTLSFCTGLDCWGNAWLAASNRIEDDGHCDGMVVDSTAVVLLPC